VVFLFSNMIKTFFHCVSPADHMYIEEYIEEDEEPPLLLGSCPSCGKYIDHMRVRLFEYVVAPSLTAACVSPRCLAVVGQQRCSVGGGKGVRVWIALVVWSLQR